MYLAGSPNGIGDNGIPCDGHLVFMAGWSVHPGSWVKREILKEHPLTNMQFLNTSKEDPLTGTMYFGSLQ
ncbi:hypothetical protein Bca4012_076324 [Brassica carinata]